MAVFSWGVSMGQFKFIHIDYVRFQKTGRLAAYLISSAAFTALPLASSVAHAQETVKYSIPAGPLDNALTRFGAASGVQVLYSSSITRGIRSPGVSGDLSSAAAAGRLLAGTGLTYQFTGPRSIVITDPRRQSAVATPGASNATTELAPIVLKSNPNSTFTPPEEYAGGQVATGGQLGLLGNSGVIVRRRMI